MSSKKKRKKRKLIDDQSWIGQILLDAREWCQNRMWWPRLLLMFLCFHILVCHLRDPLSADLFKGINLGFHEMGHVIFNPFGEFIGVCGGSLFQCLVPLLSTIMFYRQRDYFGIAFCFAWLSTNLFDVATYAADASAMDLPLVTPFKGGEPIHDWNYILTSLHMLQYDAQVGFALRALAVLSMLTFFAGGGWLLFTMMNSKTSKSTKRLTNSEQIFLEQQGMSLNTDLSDAIQTQSKLPESLQDK